MRTDTLAPSWVATNWQAEYSQSGLGFGTRLQARRLEWSRMGPGLQWGRGPRAWRPSLGAEGPPFSAAPAGPKVPLPPVREGPVSIPTPTLTHTRT